MKPAPASSASCIIVVAALLYGCGSKSGGGATGGTGGARGGAGGTIAAGGAGGTIAAGGAGGTIAAGGAGGTIAAGGAGGTIAAGGAGGTIGAGGTAGGGGRSSGVICSYPESTRCLTGQCGNGVRDTCTVALPVDCTNTTFTEWCDGADLGTATCASRGLGSGTLKCTSDCGFDTSGCSGGAGGRGGAGGAVGGRGGASAGAGGAAGTSAGGSGAGPDGGAGSGGRGGTGGSAGALDTTNCAATYEQQQPRQLVVCSNAFSYVQVWSTDCGAYRVWLEVWAPQGGSVTCVYNAADVLVSTTTCPTSSPCVNGGQPISTSSCGDGGVLTMPCAHDGG